MNNLRGRITELEEARAQALQLDAARQTAETVHQREAAAAEAELKRLYQQQREADFQAAVQHHNDLWNAQQQIGRDLEWRLNECADLLRKLDGVSTGVETLREQAEREAETAAGQYTSWVNSPAMIKRYKSEDYLEAEKARTESQLAVRGALNQFKNLWPFWVFLVKWVAGASDDATRRARRTVVYYLTGQEYNADSTYDPQKDADRAVNARRWR